MMDFEGRAHYPIELEPLPRSWSVEFLEHLCTSIQAGFASGEHNASGEGIPHIRPMNVNRLGRLDLEEVKYVAPTRDGRRLTRGDVVFNNTNSPVLIGKTCPVSTDAELAFSNHMTRLRPVDGLDYRFLASQLHYLWMGGFFLHRCVKHVNQASVSSKTLGASVPVVLPPSGEQRRIVETIESYFTRLDDAVATLERVQRNLKRYRASVLKAAVEGRLVPTEAELARAEGRDYEPASVLLERILAERRRRWEEAELAKMKAKGKAPKNDKWKAKYKAPVSPAVEDLPDLPEGWCWVTMSALTVWGPQNGLYVPKSQYGEGTPILRIDDYQVDSSRSSGDLQRVCISDADAKKYGLSVEDIVVNRVNSPSHLGKSLAVLERHLPAVFESNMMRLVLAEAVLPAYIQYYLSSIVGKARLISNAKWAVNQASINQGDVGSTPVPLPPHEEQRRIVAEIERLLSASQDVGMTTFTSASRCSRLRQSILKWAFEGRLVDQDPTDEPASLLLERIRAERDATQTGRPASARRRRTGTAT